MRIGILYNLSEGARTGEGLERTADAEIPYILRDVQAILEKRHTVIPIRFSPEVYYYLKEGNVDIVFNLCEGFGNDNLGEAYVAGLLEQLHLPFTGSGFFPLSLCMDKARTKEVLQYHKLPTPDFSVIRELEDIDACRVPLPAIIKPLHEDASIGISQDSVVDSRSKMTEKALWVFSEYKQPVLIEEYVDGRELNVSLIGNAEDLTVLPIGEILFDLPPDYHRIVCYEAKWVKESVPYNNTPVVCPAELEPSLAGRVSEISRAAFKITECKDYARVDIRVRSTGTAADAGEPYIIEVNPNPGKYIDCGFVRSAMTSGLSYEQLCYKLLEVAMDRYGMDIQLLYPPPIAGKAPLSGDSGRPSNIITRTERMVVKKVTESYLPTLLTWFNDKDIARYMDEPDATYTEQELYELLLISGAHDLDLIFFDRESMAELGYGAIYDVDYRVGSCEISVLLGDNGYRGKGYGTEMIEALVSICFKQMKLHSIFAGVVEQNLPSIRAVEKAGFRRIGVRRDSHLVDGTYCNEVLFDLIS